MKNPVDYLFFLIVMVGLMESDHKSVTTAQQRYIN